MTPFLPRIEFSRFVPVARTSARAANRASSSSAAGRAAVGGRGIDRRAEVAPRADARRHRYDRVLQGFVVLVHRWFLAPFHAERQAVVRMELIATAEAHSEAGPERVWERLVDGRRWCEWSPASDWMVAEGPIAPGTVVTIKRKRGRQTAFRIETAEAPHRLALLLTFGPAARLRIAWTLEPEGHGTLIRQTIESGGTPAALADRPASAPRSGGVER